MNGALLLAAPGRRGPHAVHGARARRRGALSTEAVEGTKRLTVPVPGALLQVVLIDEEP